MWLFDHAARAHDHAAAVSLITAANDDWATSVLLGVFLVGHLLGMLILGVALWRSRAVPLWAAALVGLAPLAHLLVHSAGRVPNAAAYALMTAGMGAGCAVAAPRCERRVGLRAAEADDRPRAAPLGHATPAGG